MEVRKRKNETNESLIRRFVRKVKKEKIIEEYREREHFKKPSEIRREKASRRQIELEKQKRKEKLEREE
jgi:ribosomal protein S21